VYVAGPYTGAEAANTRKALQAGTVLLERGYAPYVPHLTHFWHFLEPQNYETWMTFDLEWVDACDVVLRIPGLSKGADREISYALRKGIPVYWCLDALVAGVPVKQS